MIVGICNTKNTIKGTFICKCFTEGIEKSGDKTIQINEYPKHLYLLSEIDVAIQVCPLNNWKDKKFFNSPEQQFRHEIYNILQRQEKKLITIDTAAVLNQHELVDRFETKNTEEKIVETLDTVYYEIGYGGIKNYGIYYNKDSLPDRWNGFNIPLKPWNKSGKNILLVGQTPRGLSTQHIDIYSWYDDTIKTIQTLTNEKIIFRTHPRIFKYPYKYNKEINFFSKYNNLDVSNNLFLEEDLINCRAAVVFSSNAAARIIIEGTPVFVCDKSCIVWSISNRNLQSIKNPIYPDREQFFYNLAYTQWNCSEMKEGLPWKHLRKYAI